MESEFMKSAESFVQFLRKGTSTFHVVKECCCILENKGFQRINEKVNWSNSMKAQGKYYFTRNESAIVAFAVGGQFKEGNGFSIVAAHTDSPYLKLKPVSKIESNGYCSLGVETYGGGIWNTWMDRDLGLSGRVIIEERGSIVSRLLCIDECVGIVPSLAIHLRDSKERDSIPLNKETMLPPILCSSGQEGESEKEPIFEDHNASLIHLICDKLGVDPSCILDFELFLYDLNEARLGGLKKEFIMGRGLDNLACSYSALCGFVDCPDLETERNVRVMVLYDNEEVGSQSLMGAGSTMLRSVIEGLNQDEETQRMCRRKSMLLSCDMAHAVHPSYANKHETNHKPGLNQGMVIKHNARQRYATSTISSAAILSICKAHKVPYQQFVLRQDMVGGSTIGPIVSTNEGIFTIDVGLPQLAMHSVRETMGSKDIKNGIDFVDSFMRDYGKMEICVD